MIVYGILDGDEFLASFAIHRDATTFLYKVREFRNRKSAQIKTLVVEVVEDCPACGGDDTVNEDCPRCKGKGEVTAGVCPRCETPCGVCLED